MKRESYFLGGWISASVVHAALPILEWASNDSQVVYFLLLAALAAVTYIIGAYATDRILG